MLKATNNFKYSVVATTFNDEESVRRFIDEITMQTLFPQEIVIADGGSNDGTVELLNALAQDSKIPIVILSGKRLNISEGYNTAIKNASYDYIGVTGLGNSYKLDYFEKLAGKIEKDNLDGAYSPIRGLDTTGFSRQYNKDLLNGEYGQRMEIASNHGVLLKKKVFEELDYFYEKFIYAGEDTEFFLKVKKNGYHLEIVPEADVRWETPKNFFEFKKQTKVYSIAGLQINPYKQFSMVGKNVFKLCLLLIYVFALFIIPITEVPKIPLICVLAILIIIIIKRFRIMRAMQMYLQIYYSIINYKYAKEDYRVKR